MSNSTTLQASPFFWLHVKKSAGTSIRRVLAPEYIDVDRGRRPMNFIQAQPEQYNAILNNFRIPLGEYQFRRSLFAKTYLYPQTWDTMVRFAFVREPIARCISAFLYLRNQVDRERSFVQEMDADALTIEQQFDLFLELVAKSQNSQNNYAPVNLHFTTHTATMWNDVTNEKGGVLLSHLFRLDDLDHGLKTIYETCGIHRDLAIIPHANQRAKNVEYTPSAAQTAMIKKLYAADFDLYEMADQNA